MSETYKAYIIVALVYLTILSLLTKWAPSVLNQEQAGRLRNAVLFVLSSAFLLQSVWLFFASLLAIKALSKCQDHQERLLFFLVLTFCFPNVYIDIPGFAGMRYLIKLEYLMVLMLIFLIPTLKNNSPDRPFRFNDKQYPVDFYVVLFASALILLDFRDNTVTNGIRMGLISALTILAPYYAVSRSLFKPEHFSTFYRGLLIVCCLISAVAVLELLFHWRLFSGVTRALSSNLIGYTERDGLLRAGATCGSPIVLGTVLILGFSALLYLHNEIKEKWVIWCLWGLLGAGMLATISRGPWVGFALLILVYAWYSSNKSVIFFRLAALAVVSIIALAATGQFDRFVQLLPFIGSTDSGSIDYRDKLIDNAWIVFQKNMLIGSTTFLNTPEMQSMIQGQGIVDLVNTFIQLGLRYGLFGAGTLALIFAILLIKLHRCATQCRDIQVKKLCQVQIATVFAVLFTISTVSLVSFIPLVIWLTIGMASATILIANQKSAQHG